jgi:E1A/CREB-binding protein
MCLCFSFFVPKKISFEKAHRMVSSGGKITIRQVTSTDRKLEVREKMRKHYAHKNYPEEFPYRCKCLLVFQSIDGADVILFALYVYEHGKENPQPNQRTVYISYLDSVHYMRPRNLRTFIYHEILIAYLDHARREGFSKAHIWACPPLKGDDYIFYAKPEDQKTPKDKMLTKWYIDMLEESQKRDIVGKVTNMYDLYFASGTFDATDVPYLEGDYFSSEIESIIKDLEEGKGGKNSSTGKKNKKKKGGDKSKSKNGRKGTRSGGLDDSIVASLTDGKANSSGVPRDPVMVKLGEQIKHMKQSFIVAYLNWEGATPEEKAVPQKILEEREKRKLNKENPETQTKKRDANGNSKQENKRQTHHNIINDDTEEISGEIFDTRQDFLNLCKGNHYQFDAPRRAKHTSMMVLWHLHNKNAAKFVQSCIQCNREILSGIRYTCQTCTDVDVCADCYKKNPKGSRGLCTHQLVGKVVETESNKSGSGSNSNLTEKQRKERQKNINLHIKLLEHASMCNSPNCASSNCAKMKNYLEHSQDCKVCVCVFFPCFLFFFKTLTFYAQSYRKRCQEDVKYANEFGRYYDTMLQAVRTGIAPYLNVELYVIAFDKSLSSNKLWMIVDVK